MSRPFALTGDPDIDRHLQGALGKLKRKQFVSWLVILAMSGLGVWAAIVLAQLNQDEPGLLFFPLIAAVFGVYLVSKTLVQTFSTELMPVLANAVGLEYKQDYYAVQDLVNTGLLPQESVQRSQDRLMGDFGGVSVTSGDIRITSGGEDPKTLFSGLVVSLKHTESRNWLVVTTPDRARTGSTGRPLVGTRNLVETVQRKCPRGEPFTAFASDKDKVSYQGFDDYLDTVLRLKAELANCRLFSLVRYWDETHVALSCTGNPMALGGIFVTRSKLQTQVAKAVSDMQLVLQVVQILLEAEAAEKK